MLKNVFRTVSLSALVIGLSAGTASAQTFYTNEATWLAATSGPNYLEDFSTFTFGNPLNGTQPSWAAPGANGFGWTASAASNLYSNNSALSTNTANEPLVITFTGAPVTAWGGIFNNTDISGNVIAGTVTVTLSDATSSTISISPFFLGWTGPVAIASISISATGTTNNWPQLDHFYVGTGTVNNCLLPLSACPADIVVNGAVDVSDLLAVIGHWNQSGPPRPIGDCAPPPNGDCTVNVTDLLKVIATWGSCVVAGSGSCVVSPAGTCSTTNAAGCAGLGGVFVLGATCADGDGDRIPDAYELNDLCVAHAAGFYGTNPAVADSDGDNIKDGDEVYTTTGGLNLVAMGANPLHKNLFLETDWFDESTGGSAHSHRPSAAACAAVIAAFAASTKTNPCGGTGITMAIDRGQGAPFTGGNLIAGGDSVVVFDPNVDPPAPPTEFDTYKTANSAANRKGYFYYQIHCHQYDSAANGSSGVSELPGNDTIVSLQTFLSDAFVSQTMMHELGHNLTLRHGGFEHVPNYKPNYNSIMNYRYQFPGCDNNCDAVGNGVLDYSRGTNITINENTLSEPRGVCGPASPAPIVPANAIDWNGGGVLAEPGTVARNITCDAGTTAACGVACQGDSVCGSLADNNDWLQVAFTGLNDLDFAPHEIIHCEAPIPGAERKRTPPQPPQ